MSHAKTLFAQSSLSLVIAEIGFINRRGKRRCDQFARVLAHLGRQLPFFGHGWKEYTSASGFCIHKQMEAAVDSYSDRRRECYSLPSCRHDFLSIRGSVHTSLACYRGSYRKGRPHAALCFKVIEGNTRNQRLIGLSPRVTTGAKEPSLQRPQTPHRFS